jgi:hypothetical protein
MIYNKRKLLLSSTLLALYVLSVIYISMYFQYILFFPDPFFGILRLIGPVLSYHSPLIPQYLRFPLCLVLSAGLVIHLQSLRYLKNLGQSFEGSLGRRRWLSGTILTSLVLDSTGFWVRISAPTPILRNITTGGDITGGFCPGAGFPSCHKSIYRVSEDNFRGSACVSEWMLSVKIR